MYTCSPKRRRTGAAPSVSMPPVPYSPVPYTPSTHSPQISLGHIKCSTSYQDNPIGQFTLTIHLVKGLPHTVASIQISGGLYRIQHSTSRMLGQSPDHYRFPISDPAIALPCSRQTHLDGPTAQRTAAGVSNHVHNIAPNQERTFPAHTKCSLTSKCAH